ncbi:hypothetical protein TNIN_414311 [Trichonephila inaurata madagascariensis]|uniref:Uncharacterized protein n=1 Tax=Trichonephila inaurata madagascariensis TaxID=2747483 RepID=A0A8X6X7W3_9ARAC|nr:hypothetical protein TNIN_414311 [Trichonephila inaurata madagascariensis]
MSDSETESDSVSGASFKSRSSISSSSGSMISDPPVLSACQKKKQGLEAISTLDNIIADHRIIKENEKRTGRPEPVLQIQNSIETFLEIRKKMIEILQHEGNSPVCNWNYEQRKLRKCKTPIDVDIQAVGIFLCVPFN